MQRKMQKERLSLEANTKTIKNGEDEESGLKYESVEKKDKARVKKAIYREREK